MTKFLVVFGIFKYKLVMPMIFFYNFHWSPCLNESK